MSIEIEDKLMKIPIVRQLVLLGKSIKLPWLHGLSLYDLLELYIIGIVEGAVSYRATAIAFSFFMALFPFALFILNLIPYIPIVGFQEDFMNFVHQSLPPTTFDAVSKILNDILHNSHSGLLSTGFFMAIFLMANGVNAILGGFESSHHVTLKRKYFRQYFISLGLSIILSLILIITVAAIVIFEVFIQKTKIQDVLSDNIPLIEMGRYAFVVLMILITTSLLFKFGTKQDRKRSFISITSYFFGIWVLKFSKYNELYGSIGTLLIVMFFIWINSMILLLGFELNATINRLKQKHERELETISSN
jgi:membrane protein